MPLMHIVHVIDDDDAGRATRSRSCCEPRASRSRPTNSPSRSSKPRPRSKAGCIITDVRMPEMSGIDLLRRLKELRLDVPVIVITGHGDVPLAVEAMKLGAVDFLEKPFDDEALLASVRSASIRRTATGRAPGGAGRNRAAGWRRCRTAERQVLDGLVAGHPNKTIAYDLGISPRTVEVYRANVMTKMQAASLSDLVRMALIAGILGTLPDGSKV